MVPNPNEDTEPRVQLTLRWVISGNWYVDASPKANAGFCIYRYLALAFIS